MNRTAMIVAMLAGSAAFGQDDPAVASAAQLLEQLRAAGVEIPDGFAANDDGSVSLPAPPDAAEMADAVVDTAGAASVPDAKEAEWDTKLNLGLNLAAGNTEQLGFAATVVSERTTDDTVLTLDAGYFYASQDGDDTANRFTAGLNNDWLMQDSRWLIFAGARFDYDDFKSYDYRVSANAGVGYELIKRDNMQLTLRAGGGFSKEFGSSRNEIIPEGLLGADFNWDYADNQSFYATTRIFPDLAESGEFRTFSTAGWKLDIDKDDGLAFTVNLIHEYTSDVDPGIEKTDLQLFAGLTYDF